MGAFLHRGIRISLDLSNKDSRAKVKRTLPSTTTCLFEPELDQRGRFSNLTSSQEAELGGVEYRALVLLTWLLPCYVLFWILLIVVILTPYAPHSHVADIIRHAQPGSLDPSW